MPARVLQIGIDEAGYAPKIGPLVLTAVSVERPGGTGDLYAALAPAVSRSKAGRGVPPPRPLHIGDSKAVYGSKKNIAELERGALAFLRCALSPTSGERAARTDLALARALGPLDLEGLAWYSGEETSLPLKADAADVDASTERLRAALAEADLRRLTIRASIVTAGELNAAIARGLNKAEFEVELVARMMARMVGGGEDVSGEAPLQANILCDRLGGRHDYLPLLRLAFPEARVDEIERGKVESRYRVEDRRERLRAGVRFACRAESQCMLVAVASMVSKYVRELFMRRLNRWFIKRASDLKPTAGYPVDAARFLAETADLRAREGVADEAFVRSR